MLTLDAARYDFKESFPVPRDDDRHRAGRQGLLDQKEGPEVSAAQWVAIQHREWFDELRGYHLERFYLQACMSSHVDPGTGQPPRSPQAWAAMATRMQAEVLRLEVMVGGMLGDYADHFGRDAAEAFGAFVQAAVLAEPGVGPSQLTLFAC